MMKRTHPLATALVLAPLWLCAAEPDLSKVASRDDLQRVIERTSNTSLKEALASHATEILNAAKQHPHVQAVINTIEKAPGAFTKINATPDALKKAFGGELALFETLTAVSTSIVNGRPHVYRGADEDPYDAAFIEHLGHIASLESVKIVATKIEDSWLPPLLKLKNLKSLSMEGRATGLPGKPALGDQSLARLRELEQFEQLSFLELAYFANATDAGLEQLAGLKRLESFTFRGSPVKGHAFAKFEGWTKLKSIRFHSNSLDDKGLGNVCARFPNLESLNLIHSHDITDASAAHLLKLPKLKSIQINGPKITAAMLKNLPRLPLEHAMIDQGAIQPASEAIATMKAVPTLRRLAIGGKPLTDADLAALAGVNQVEELSFENLDLPDSRLLQLQAFVFLKTLTLALRPAGYPSSTQAKINALLPKVEVKFVQ
jgi:hypothetical protein